LEEKKKLNRQVMILIAVIAVLAIIGIAYIAVSNSAAQVVVPGDNVSVYYTGALVNGTVFDTNVGRQPFQFTVGANEVIPGFDNAVIGMRLNQTKNVTIPVNEAYGPVSQELIINVPLTSFGNHTVQVGMEFSETLPSGQQMTGVVTSVNAENATLNFNPPLAGKILVFKIKVVGIKK